MDTVRTGNIGRKDPTARFEYHFFVKEKKEDVLYLNVPADNYKNAKRGLKGALRSRDLIKEKYKPPKR